MRNAIIVLIIALGLTGWGLYHEIRAGAVKSEQIAGLTKAADQAAKQRLKDRKVLVARAADIASKRRELAKAQEALSEALQRNNDWSNTSVPIDVQQALQGASTPADVAPETP